MAFIHRDTFKIYNRSKIGDNELQDIDAFFEVDDIIAPVISKLNIRGYATKYCCQGHPYRIFDDDMFTLNPGELLQDVIHQGDIHREVHHVFPVSAHTSYVFYETDVKPRAYIMFQEGVRLPFVLEGWNIDVEYSTFTIEKIYDVPSSPISFFSQLVQDMEEMLRFVEMLPPCTTSPDEEWNECILELISKLPNINDVEIEMIRKLYVDGKEPDQILNTLVNFKN